MAVSRLWRQNQPRRPIIAHMPRTSQPKKTSVPAFYFLEPSKGSVAAFEDPDGLSVPFFTDQQSGQKADSSRGGKRRWKLVSVAVEALPAFSERCRAAGAKTLRMDPRPSDLAAVELRPLALGRTATR